MIEIYVTGANAAWLIYMPGHYTPDDLDVYDVARSLPTAKRLARGMLPEGARKIRWRQEATNYWVLTAVVEDE